jgi:GntR family histidine utilization transcriptional repressor
MTVNRALRELQAEGLVLRSQGVGTFAAPLQCEDRYVNPACAPGYLQADFTQTTPTRYLFAHTALWRAQYSIESALPTAQEARLLGLEPATPCLVVVRRTFTRDAAITIARLVHPGPRYRLTGEFSP